MLSPSSSILACAASDSFSQGNTLATLFQPSHTLQTSLPHAHRHAHAHALSSAIETPCAASECVPSVAAIAQRHEPRSCRLEKEEYRYWKYWNKSVSESDRRSLFLPHPLTVERVKSPVKLKREDIPAPVHDTFLLLRAPFYSHIHSAQSTAVPARWESFASWLVTAATNVFSISTPHTTFPPNLTSRHRVSWEGEKREGWLTTHDTIRRRRGLHGSRALMTATTAT